MRRRILIAVGAVLLGGLLPGGMDGTAAEPVQGGYGGISPLPADVAKMNKEEPGALPVRLDPAVIRDAAGSQAGLTPDNVVRIGWLRDDVPVTVDGSRLPPSAGLGSWAGFVPAPEGALMMGDTVVFQDEVDAALDAALAGGLEVTALHNHFFFDEPRVYFMHIGGHGPPAELASAVKGVWTAIRAVRAQRPQPATGFPGAPPTPGDLHVPELEAILGTTGTLSSGVFKVSLGRSGRHGEVQVGEAMGLNTWAAFTGSAEHATVDGDFIMTGPTVQVVLRALRGAGIHVVSLHSHMIGEEPRFFFLHYWGKGPATELARAFRAALEAQRRAEG